MYKEMFCRNGCEDLIIRENYVITGGLYDEAVSYAKKSRAYTSNRHDFHPGGLINKEKKMFEGKLGEKAVKILLIDNDINFVEDTSSYDEPDEYDFLLVNENEQLKIDVKTRTEDYHIRTLEMVEQAKNKPVRYRLLQMTMSGLFRFLQSPFIVQSKVS